MKARTLSRRTRRICCGTSSYLLFLSFFFLFFVPSCLPFSHSSLGERLQDRRKPRPRTARSDSLFFMQFPRFVCPRHRAILFPFPLPPDYRVREKCLAEHENLRAPRSPRDHRMDDVADEKEGKERDFARMRAINSLHRY